MTVLLDELRDPAVWPAPRPASVELIETHVSWVLRSDREVLKIKKPVALGFLDFRSLDRRRAACEAEVRLNARLAPGVYGGVVPIVRRQDGSVGIGESGPPIEWAVRMQRLDDGASGAALLARGELQPSHLRTLAEAIAQLHRRSVVDRVEAEALASPAAVERNVRENFAQIHGAAASLVDPKVVREVEARQTGFVREHGALFTARLRRHVCDGHGDLRLEHAYFTPAGLRVIDCIEFDERYRVADACADVAFLAMDLASHDRPDLAEVFLGCYARAAQDYDLYALVDFYEGYRAWVRGKVSAMLAADPSVGEEARSVAATAARRHFLLAQACERAPLLPPSLLCVGGIVASGKSTVAEALAAELSCPVVDTDRTRKHLLGLSRTEHVRDAAWRGAYAPAVTDRVYDEVLRRSSIILASGRSVIVDASFRSAQVRRRARDLACAHGVEFRFVHCAAPPPVCLERLAHRPDGPSDAHPAIFAAFATAFEPLKDLPASEVVELDTTRPFAQSRAALRARLMTWPLGLR